MSRRRTALVWDGSETPSAFNTYCATGTSFVPEFLRLAWLYRQLLVALRPGGADFAGDPVSVNSAESGQINLSAPLDGTTWDPLQYSTKEGGPDAGQMIYTPGSIGGGGPEELWIFGKRTTEVWYNTVARNQCIFRSSAFPELSFNKASGRSTP